MRSLLLFSLCFFGTLLLIKYGTYEETPEFDDAEFEEYMKHLEKNL